MGIICIKKESKNLPIESYVKLLLCLSDYINAFTPSMPIYYIPKIMASGNNNIKIKINLNNKINCPNKNLINE